MTLYETLMSKHEEPRRKPKMPKQSRNLASLYELLAPMTDEIEDAMCGGYCWAQVYEHIEEQCINDGTWDNRWNRSLVEMIFTFIKKEREIKSDAA